MAAVGTIPAARTRRNPSMLIRCAFFEGRVRDGKDAAFADFVQQQLLPLWQRFPGSTAVRVLRPVAADPAAPPIQMMLEFDYPSQAAIDLTMASPERAFRSVGRR
ncbi:MAG: hypothetical protein R3D62_10520 [Xanthobacteraceae bacterium]